jgi:hypothetical protein
MFFPILNKMSWIHQNLQETRNFNLDKNTINRYRVIKCGQTDMTTLIGTCFDASLRCTKTTEAVIWNKDSGDLLQKLNT